MAGYIRPPRPDDRITLPPVDPVDKYSDDELRKRVANFPKGPLIPVEDSRQAALNQPAPTDESAEQLIAEQDGGGPININMDPNYISSRLSAIAKEMANVKFPAQQKRSEGVDLTADIADLKDRLAALDKQQESDTKDIEKRQLYSEIATQLGKFAAAQYGLKNNVDMAGLKPEAPKFENEYERLLNKYKTSKQETKDNAELGMKDTLRRADRADRMVGDDNAYSMDKFKATEEGRVKGLEMEAKGLLTAEQLKAKRDLAAAKTAGKEGATTDKAALQREQAYGKLAATVNGIFSSKGSKDMKVAKAMAILQTNPLTKSIPKAEWESILQQDGWFGKDSKSPQDALAGLTQKLSELAVANTPAASAAATASGQSTPPGAAMITVRNKKTGVVGKYSANDPRLPAVRNNPDFEVK
jgi:hypothetical protein